MTKQHCNGFTQRNTHCKKPAGATGYCYLHNPAKLNTDQQEEKMQEPTLLADRLKVLL